VAAIGNLGEAPSINDLIGNVKVMLDAFHAGRIDRLYLVSNKFINTMTQKPNIDQLLPLASLDAGETPRKGRWDSLCAPDAQHLLHARLVRFLESQVYQGLVENGAAQQAARMIAIKSASDSARHLIRDLHLVYYTTRQAAITQEISD